jgi:hypothetical protein
MLNSIFPNPTTKQPSSFSAPTLGRIATIPYDISAADGRGGGAHGRQLVTVSPAGTTGTPSATLTVSPASGPPGTTVTLNLSVSDPDRDQFAWDIFTGMKNAASGWCCFTGTSTQVTLNDAGLYRIGMQVMDSQLNLAARPTVVVRIGGATVDPPIASAAVDKLNGPLPLTVNIDMSGCSAPSSSIGTTSSYVTTALSPRALRNGWEAVPATRLAPTGSR